MEVKQCFIAMSDEREIRSENAVNDQGKRIEPPCQFDFRKSLITLSTIRQMLGVPVVRGRVIRIQRNGLLKFFLSSLPIPIVVLFDQSKRYMSFGQSGIDL